MYTKCSAKFAVRLKRSGKSSWRSVEIADISWYVLGKNVVVKDLNMLDDDDDDGGDGVSEGAARGFLSNDGTAPISILIVHKFQVKVSVCTAR